MLDHSYSKSIQSLCKPQSRRESKGVAALLSLANAASKELESLCKEDPSDQPSRNARTKCNSNAIKKQMNLIKSKSSSLEGVVSTQDSSMSVYVLRTFLYSSLAYFFFFPFFFFFFIFYVLYLCFSFLVLCGIVMVCWKSTKIWACSLRLHQRNKGSQLFYSPLVE